VNTRFEQLLHGDVSQKTSFLSLHPSFKCELGIAFPSPHRSTGRIKLSAISRQLSVKPAFSH
jgi:hypothetical protein